ncbi:MAG: peptidylprolyl isomerase [Candidatus Merdivicinus sp.]|jgi:peptidyl-prolyl cis-trans isomerase B (cyclophilin B)
MKFLKKAAALLAACAMTASLLSGCGNTIDPSTIDYIQFEQPEEGQDIAIVDTSMGEITILLYTDEVPELVDNFKKLVEEGFFNNQVIFHVEPSVGIVAAGSSTPDGNGGGSSTGKPIKATYSDNLWPFTGSVSMICYEAGVLWNRGNYCDSRFFILGKSEISDEIAQEMDQYNFPAMMKNCFKEYGGVPQFGQTHSVFGKVIDGMEVVEAILDLDLTYESVDLTQSEVSATNEQLNNNRPLEDVVINSVTLSTFHAADFDELDNTPTEEELKDLIYRSTQEQQEQDAAMMGETSAAE